MGNFLVLFWSAFAPKNKPTRTETEARLFKPWRWVNRKEST